MPRVRAAAPARVPAAIRPAADAGIALGALAIVFLASSQTQPPLSLGELLLLRVSVLNLLLLAAFACLWPYALGAWGVYDAARRPGWGRIVAGTLTASPLVLAFTLPEGTFTLRSAVAFWLLATALTLGARGAGIVLAPAGTERARRVLIVGSGPRALRLFHEMRAAGACEVLGFVDHHNHSGDAEFGRMWLGTLGKLESLLLREAIDEVVIALPIRSCYSQIQHAITLCEAAGVESKYLADVFTCSLAEPRFEGEGRNRVVSMKVSPEDPRHSVKRVLDVAGALAGLVLLAPVLAAIALAVKLTSHGPVIFAQERHGMGRRPFRMYKFRTMVADAERRQASLEAVNEADGPVFKIRNDPRVTPLGAWLRRTSLDELPQLWNVLRGEMSLVGPRPLPLRDVRHFQESWLMRRFSVKPGLTCLWQIRGRSDVGFDDWMALDLQYIDRWSLALDLRIIARTVPAVLRGAGAV
jgi:exopolysaccharide biosynthesis polyprenyl glycosylphosphotransferase